MENAQIWYLTCNFLVTVLLSVFSNENVMSLAIDTYLAVTLRPLPFQFYNVPKIGQNLNRPKIVTIKKFS